MKDGKTAVLRTIVKRELADQILSLRFSAIFVLTLFLMVTSVLVSSAAYRRAIREHPKRVAGLVNEDGQVNLGSVPCQGGATVRQSPSSLAFISGAGESQLPNEAVLAVHGLRGIQRSADIGDTSGGSSPVDWAFVVAVVLSFGAGLLTYKSVSGERRDGTLSLLLSNSVSKSTVLLGKYLAALAVLAAVFTAAMLVGLIIGVNIGAVPFRGDDVLKIGLFWLISLLYLSLFILIGLLCSVFGREPLPSAVAFLFIWAGLAFIVPNLGGILAGQVGAPKTPFEIHELAKAIPDQFSLTSGMSADEVASVKLRRELAKERLLVEHVQSLVRQVRLGQDLTRVSPASTFSYAAERIAGGGTFRMMRFIDNAIRFRQGFFRAMIEADKQDPASQHRYVPWWCGSDQFSQRLVDLGPAKDFHDAPPTSGEGLAAAWGDVLLLVIYNILAFAAAFWRFARQSVAPSPGV